MKIEEINKKIAGLEEYEELLRSTRDYMIWKGYNVQSDFIKALNDEIKYTLTQLDKYRNSEWVCINMSPISKYTCADVFDILKNKGGNDK